MQAFLSAIQRWEDEGGALEHRPAMAPRLFFGRGPNATVRRHRLTEHRTRKRMERVAWFVGLGLLLLMLLNISGVLSAGH